MCARAAAHPINEPLSCCCSVLPACSCLPGMRACLFCFCEKVGPPPHPVPAAGIGCLGPLSCNCRGPPTQIWWGPDGKHGPFRFYFPQGFPRGPKASRTGQLRLPSLQYTAGNGCGGGHPSLNLLPPPPHSYVRRSTSTTPYPQWMRGPCSSVPRLHATPQRVPSSTRKWMRGPCSSVPPPVSATAGRAMAAEAAAASSVPTASSSTADAGAEPLTASSATTASSTAPATVPTPPRGGAQSPGPRG